MTRWKEMKIESIVCTRDVDDMLEKHLSQFQMLKLIVVVFRYSSL